MPASNRLALVAKSQPASTTSFLLFLLFHTRDAFLGNYPFFNFVIQRALLPLFLFFGGFVVCVEVHAAGPAGYQ